MLSETLWRLGLATPTVESAYYYKTTPVQVYIRNVLTITKVYANETASANLYGVRYMTTENIAKRYAGVILRFVTWEVSYSLLCIFASHNLLLKRYLKYY
jgi:hypothetical protein